MNGQKEAEPGAEAREALKKKGEDYFQKVLGNLLQVYNTVIPTSHILQLTSLAHDRFVVHVVLLACIMPNTASSAWARGFQGVPDVQIRLEKVEIHWTRTLGQRHDRKIWRAKMRTWRL